MIILFQKSQLALFDTPVRVATHVRKDGVVIPEHTAMRKKGVHPAHHGRLQAFIDKHGGVAGMTRTLSSMSAAHQQRLYVEMAKLGGITPEQVAAQFPGVSPAPAPVPDMFTPPPAPAAAEPAQVVENTGDEERRSTDDEHPAPTPRQSLRGLSDADRRRWLELHRTQHETHYHEMGKVRAEMERTHSKKNKAETAMREAEAGLESQRKAPVPDVVREGQFEGAVGAHRAEFKKHAAKLDELAGHLETLTGLRDRLGKQKDEILAGSGDLRMNLMSGQRTTLQEELDAQKHFGRAYRDYFKGKDKKPKRATKAPKGETNPPPAETKPAEPETPAIDTHDRSAPFGVAAGISKADRRSINNQVAARIAQGGPYDGADRALMRQYSGNGGCGDSLNEYYTDPDVTRAMWEVIGSLGITHGDALEPSCGTGVFLHTAPAGFKVTGVELDPVSATVATVLHGDRHEVHTAAFERFATMDDRQFDVVIGNPPYGPRGMLAKDDKKQIGTAEQYFVDTAIDKAKPGGIIALVVPTGILDSSSARSMRQGWLCRAEFLGAQRMPNTAFEHSHTEVTTDVVYFRKRPDAVGQALNVLDDKVADDQAALKKLGVWDEEFIAGSYFTGRGAANILGTMGPGWRAQAGMGNDITVNGSMAGVPEALAAFTADSESRPATELTVDQVLETITNDETRERARNAAQRDRPYLTTAKVGDVKTVDGVQYILQGDPPRWHRVDEFMQAPAIADAGPIAAEIDRLFNGQAVNRPQLEADVRAWVAKHGIPADNKDLMTAASSDKRLFRLVGAVNRQGELSDAVLGKGSRALEGGFDVTAEAMALEAKSADFTAAELAERLGKDLAEVEDQLAADARYAWVSEGRWTPMSMYLTGELWPKLDAAKAALAGGHALQDKLADQVSRLEKAIDPKALEDVEVQLNSAFLPLHVVEAFFNWKQYDSDQANEWTRKQKPVEITFRDGVYIIRGGNEYGTSKLLDKYLNRTGVRKEEDLPQLERLNDEFKQWLCASQYRDAVEDLYNRKFRGFVQRDFSDEPMDVPGLTTDRDVRAWRWSSLRRSLADGKGIIADDVGLGKTLGGLLLARMAKMQGTAKRPIIVVPKSVLANWYAESQVWFPGSRVLTIGANFARDKAGELVGRDDDAAERKRKYHDLTQNDYDFVFISEPAFEEVDLNPETKEKYYGEDFWVQRGEALGNAGDKRRKAIREKFEQHLAQREFADRTDAIWFDDLGVDMLIADEMHHQKNLYAARARFGENPKFLGGQGLSNRALDFNLKTRWVRENGGNGKGIYGLTATPTKNSPLEIYSMLSHIAPEAFENIGIRNSEEFLDRFCEFQQDKVLGTNGSIEDALVVSGFKNLDELREIMFRFIDRRTAQDVGLKLPERDQQTHLVDMTPAQQNIYAELRALAEESSGKKDATGDSHIFSIMDKMGKAALDLALLGHEGARSPKLEELAKHVVAGAKEGGQIVFCESVPTHDKIVRSLVDAGIPREQIGIINAQVAGSAVKRQNIADKFNAGKLKVVIGNVTMAEGLNLQKTTTDIHELDIPWEPATVQQRLGRGIRQGNLNESVRTHSYLAKGSFDGYRYQAVHAKRDWQDLLWNGGDRVENLAREGNLTLDDMRIMLSADPDEARKKFDEDKSAAMKRYEADQRADAQKQFVRFVDLSRSYSALKNKETKSATMLRDRIEAAKTSLFNNKYWPAKSALDSASDTLIHPATGATLTANVGLEMPGEGKVVVTGVNMRDGTVTIRRYADLEGGKRATVKLDELKDAALFKYDAEAEGKEAQEKFEAAAAEKLDGISKWEEIAALPTAVIDKNKDMLQERIKQGMKDYKFTMPYGDVTMINKETGALESVESYHARDKHDTHDYLLPTSDAKEKAIQAFMDARRGAKIGSHFHASSGKRGRNKSYSTAAREYAGTRYDGKHVNPFKAALQRLGGDSRTYGVDAPLVKEAKERMKSEQMQRIRRAASIKDAFDAIYPLAKVEGRNESYGDAGMTARYPKEALTMLWARARHLGDLGKPMSAVFDKKHSNYAIAGAHDLSVHNALLKMALQSGHNDLAEAMLEGGRRHHKANIDAETVRVLAQGWNHSRALLQHLHHAADQAGILDMTPNQLREYGLTGKFAPYSGYGGYYTSHHSSSGKTMRELIAESLETAK
jgi:SNF2 family DNA or RNA helicase/predicted RNA methylase